MHIPDGFLSNRVALSLDALSGATILYAVRRVKVEAAGRLIPLMGVLGAFVFAAQLLNFPVLGGTSGHLVGGTLLAILLGPLAGLLTMSTVIIAQALFLQDGGIVALGANIFNIGTVTTFGGYALFCLLGGHKSEGRQLGAAAFSAGWLALMLSAVCCACELGLSGAIALRVGLPAMAGYHALIGIAEGGLTAGVLVFLARVRPDLIDVRSGSKLGAADWIWATLLAVIPAVILVLAGSSSLPDPLQELLAAAAAAPRGGGAPEKLVSPERYLEYLGRAGILLLLAGLVYLAVCLARRHRRRS